MNLAAVIVKLKVRCRGTTQKLVARELEVPESYLSDVIRGRRDPGPKILAGLGLEKVTRYKPIR